MRINQFSNICISSALLLLGAVIVLIFQLFDTLGKVTEAERHRHKSLQLANELFLSSEELTRMARSYVITGDPIYERYFFKILDIRNGKQPRPRNYSATYWYLVGKGMAFDNAPGETISLLKLMRREGISEYELSLLRESQMNSDMLVKLEEQSFAAMKGLFDDGRGNFIVQRAPDRDFAIGLLFGDRYNAKKVRIMTPITQFIQELDDRTKTKLTDLQSKSQYQLKLILGLLCLALFGTAMAIIYMRRNILRPLHYLGHQANTIAQGNYVARCVIDTHNELATLGADFNTMAEAIEHDIIKREQMELGLLQAKENAEHTSAELSAYIEAIGKLALISVTDCSGRILQVNSKFCDVSDYSEAELVGQNHRILNSGTHPKAFFVDMWTTIARGEVWHEEICNRSKNGQLYWVDSTIVPLKDGEGKISRYISIRVDVTERKQAQAHALAERELQAHNAAMRKWAAHVEQMQEKDRKYISREIHDEVGQILAALRLEISRMSSGRGISNEKMKNIQHNATELVDKAIQSIRSVVKSLRPASLELGIVDAIQKLQTEFTKHSDTVCILQLPENLINLDEEQTIAIFRVVQESLTNVARHAEASCVEIALIQSADDVIVEIRDDGKGFDSLGTTETSFGLLGMRERVAAIKGNIEITSTPQQGTLVSVRIPMNRNQDGSTPFPRTLS